MTGGCDDCDAAVWVETKKQARKKMEKAKYSFRMINLDFLIQEM